MEAERESAKIVAQARQCKTLIILDRIQRLKEARSEAVKEIELLKIKKNFEFEEFEKNVFLFF